MYWIGCSHGDGGVTPPRPGQTQFLSRRQRPTRPIHAASPWLNSHPHACEKEYSIGEACAESGVWHIKCYWPVHLQTGNVSDVR